MSQENESTDLEPTDAPGSESQAGDIEPEPTSGEEAGLELMEHGKSPFPHVPGGDWLALDEDDSSWLDLPREELVEMIDDLGRLVVRIELEEAEAGRALSDDETFDLLVGVRDPSNASVKN